MLWNLLLVVTLCVVHKVSTQVVPGSLSPCRRGWHYVRLFDGTEKCILCRRCIAGMEASPPCNNRDLHLIKRVFKQSCRWCPRDFFKEVYSYMPCSRQPMCLQNQPICKNGTRMKRRQCCDHCSRGFVFDTSHLRCLPCCPCKGSRFRRNKDCPTMKGCTHIGELDSCGMSPSESANRLYFTTTMKFVATASKLLVTHLLKSDAGQSDNQLLHIVTESRSYTLTPKLTRSVSIKPTSTAQVYLHKRKITRSSSLQSSLSQWKIPTHLVRPSLNTKLGASSLAVQMQYENATENATRSNISEPGTNMSKVWGAIVTVGVLLLFAVCIFCSDRRSSGKDKTLFSPIETGEIPLEYRNKEVLKLKAVIVQGLILEILKVRKAVSTIAQEYQINVEDLHVCSDIFIDIACNLGHTVKEMLAAVREVGGLHELQKYLTYLPQDLLLAKVNRSHLEKEFKALNRKRFNSFALWERVAAFLNFDDGSLQLIKRKEIDDYNVVYSLLQKIDGMPDRLVVGDFIKLLRKVGRNDIADRFVSMINGEQD